MTEITWAAIIAVAGTLLGSIAGGLISYKIAEKQAQIRLRELTQQLEHQERESRRDRLIKRREPYLIPLGETVSKWVIELTHLVDQINAFGRALKLHEQSPFLYSEPDPQEGRLEEMKEGINALKEELKVLRGQSSDSFLNAYIDMVLAKETDIRIDSWPILHSTLEQWKSGKRDIESIDEALDKIAKRSVELREYLHPVSKRVEELLVGDEAK